MSSSRWDVEMIKYRALRAGLRKLTRAFAANGCPVTLLASVNTGHSLAFTTSELFNSLSSFSSIRSLSSSISKKSPLTVMAAALRFSRAVLRPSATVTTSPARSIAFTGLRSYSSAKSQVSSESLSGLLLQGNFTDIALSHSRKHSPRVSLLR